MFFKPKKYTAGAAVSVSADAAVSGFEGYALTLINRLVSEQGTKDGSVAAVCAQHDSSVADEGYRILIDPAKITVSASGIRGFIYAAVTLLTAAARGELCEGELEDEPDCSFRGYRVYLPGRASFQKFYNMVDTIVMLKYNHISLEIGGAMEYKRHPEINKRWAEFAADTHRYSDRTHEIQNGYPWQKNSIHTDNGEGDILTQDEVRTLINYCRERGLEVYPEVPSLSHTDYICMAHPEVAERDNDDYADTYCPSNPDSYKLMFDVLDEVIEVFRPKLINIGHDEYYSMCICDRCRGKKAEELFAADVTKIHDYLSERGIKTAMWCDKLLPVVTVNGKFYGGSGCDRITSRGDHWYYPPTFKCQCMLPRDILMINWYHSFGTEYDFMIHKHGYPMIYGNMSVPNVKPWRMRKNAGLIGGSCSNWGSNDEEYMQRNCQYMNLVMGAYAMWSADYDSTFLDELTERAFEECYRMHYGDLSGYIEVTHTTDKFIKYKVFYDGVFIEDDIYHMGKYLLTYTDGDTAEFEVKYGTNISSSSLTEKEREADPTVGVSEKALWEVSYSTVPSVQNGRTFYRTAFKNPHPEKKVKSFEYIPENGDVEISAVVFHA